MKDLQFEDYDRNLLAKAQGSKTFFERVFRHMVVLDQTAETTTLGVEEQRDLDHLMEHHVRKVKGALGFSGWEGKVEFTTVEAWKDQPRRLGAIG